MQLNDLEFAHELPLLSHTHEQMKTKTTSVAAASASVGLNIHKGKTKILKRNTKNTNSVTLYGVAQKQVKTSTYLDRVVDGQGGSDVDENARISEARTIFLQLKNIWNSKKLSTNVKARIFNTNIKTVLLYGAET
ncbi:unnamed protein product [Schistosoma curassoni]|uniref:DUF6451 domain-containing protein n=1 Tax=Schistosoma curassoni TaxID=6186 RepID=A0A183KF60_9TREM|nr:unnamed protein product [Schistosoma curassoni]